MMLRADVTPPAVTPADCWKVSGRTGPGTCPALREHVVCANCPSYSDLALRILDRPLSPEYVREWTVHLSRETAHAEAAAASALVFRLEQEWFGIPVDAVEQVTETSTVHSLPHRTLPVRGVVSLRGELIVCLSLGALLGLEHAAPSTTTDRFTRMVVLTSDAGRVAFVPDEVQGVVRYPASASVAAPATLAGRGSHYTASLLRWDGRTVACLDPVRLFAAVARSLS